MVTNTATVRYGGTWCIYCWITNGADNYKIK